MSAQAKNLEAISKAIDQHNRSCPQVAAAIAMNPFEIDRLGWDEIRGLPIIPDSSLGTGSFRVVCEKSHEPGLVVEDEAQEAISTSSKRRTTAITPGVAG